MTRFDGLDRLRGVALWAMLVHHLLAWALGEEARSLIPGVAGFVVTDLAAPMFTVAAGAAAALVGRRLRERERAGLGRVLRKWAVIGAWGVLLGVVIDHQVDTVGVLEVLAIAGVVVTVVAVVVVPSAAVWTVVALALTIASGPVIDAATDAGGWWQAVFGDRFPLVSYLALAAWGAAVVDSMGPRERTRELWWLVAGGSMILLVGGLAGMDVWPPDRYPSDAAFVVPGLVGTLLVWAVLAELPESLMTRAMARAGRRTLVVFVGHYAVRVLLDAGGWWQELKGPGWAAAAIGTAVVIAVLSALPSRRERQEARLAAAAGEQRPDVEAARW